MAEDIFRCILWKENIGISIWISLKIIDFCAGDKYVLPGVQSWKVIIGLCNGLVPTRWKDITETTDNIDNWQINVTGE